MVHDIRGMFLALVACLVLSPEPVSAQQQSPRQALKERFQPRNILLNASDSSPVSDTNMSLPAGSPMAAPTYAIYHTEYEADIAEDIALVTERVQLEVFAKSGVTRIPLVNSAVGLKEVSLNRKPSIVTREGDRYVLLIEKPGRYHVDIEFFVKVNREREHGPGRFTFDVLPSPISMVDVQIAEPDLDIVVEPSIKLEKETVAGKTLATAVLPYTEQVTIRWNQAIGKIDLPTVKLEPKLYADVATLVSIGDGVAQCSSTLQYSILQSEVSTLRAILPGDVTVLDVQAGELRDWKVASQDGHTVIDVYFDRGIKGAYPLTLRYEKVIGEGSVTAQVPELSLVGVEREQGVVGIQAQTNVEITFRDITNATPIDVKELPHEVWNRAPYPILLAYKYLKHPVSVTIDVAKHEELPVLVAAIDSAHYVSLLTGEGKTLTKVTLQTRNNVKQFMRLQLPNGATLLNGFVSGKPVKPAQDEQGRVLIPLEKSESLGETVTQFPVEVMYLTHRPPFGLSGALDVRLPTIDIPTSQLYWSVYLPEEFHYGLFGGDVRQVRQPGLIWPAFELQRRLGQQADEAPQSSNDRLNSLQAQVGYEKRADEEFQGKDNRVAGTLPIKIDMPTAGKLVRFSKLLVTDESPWFHCRYVRNLSDARGLLNWVVFVLLACAGWLLGRAIRTGQPLKLGQRSVVGLFAAGALVVAWLAQVSAGVILAGLLVGGLSLLTRRGAG